MLIDDLRVLKNLSIEELAQEAGVSIATVSRIINGIPVRRSSAEKVCKVLDVPIENVVVSGRKLGRRPKVRKG